MSYAEYRPDTSTWYHEAGHAVAAVLRGGHVDYLEFGCGDVETSAPVEGQSNQAFMTWAGPWAQIYQEDEGNCSIERVAGLFHTQSLWDWPRYEEAMDPVGAAERDIRGFAADIELAATHPEHPPMRNLDHLPQVTAPDPSWNEELLAAWPKIASLAESLMNGESPIRLSNEQELVRYDDFDFWFDRDRVGDPRPKWWCVDC